MKDVMTLSLGNRFAKTSMPSGLAIRLRNRMRSSETPLEIKTSTAIAADPPDFLSVGILPLRANYSPVASIGSSNKTQRLAISSGNLS